MSTKVYDDNITTVENHQIHAHFMVSGSMKSTLVTTTQFEDSKLLVVTIRGTASFDDWLLNINGDPETSPNFDNPNLWHRGLLQMAVAMQEKIAAVVRRIGLSSSPPEQILFWGHSAGGAIAQLLSMLSMQKNSVLG